MEIVLRLTNLASFSCAMHTEHGNHHTHRAVTLLLYSHPRDNVMQQYVSQRAFFTNEQAVPFNYHFKSRFE